MNKNVTVEYWNIDFEEDTARFSLEDDDEGASIIVDVVIKPELERRTCSIERVMDCWYLSDYDQRVEKTQISKEELAIIKDILENEYKKYLGE